MGEWDFEGKPWFNQWPAWLMVIFALAEASFLFIQGAKTFQSKSAEDLSIIAFIVFLLASIAWVVWGVVTRDVPVLFSGALNTVGSIFVLTGIFLYGTDVESGRREQIKTENRK